MNNRYFRILVVVMTFASLLVGCSAPLAATTHPDVQVAATTSPELGPIVSPDVVAQLYAGGGVTVIDVREEWEYAEGHIPGATLIPLGTLAQRIDEIPTDQPVILVCRSDNRSGQAYRWLRQQGLDNVHNMSGGMLAWQAAGLEIEK
jgi:phage shock protein E